MTKILRAIRIEGNIAYVPLTRGYEAVIDAADVPLVDHCNWCALVQKNHVYAVHPYTRNGKSQHARMHRVIMGEPDGLLVDHIDCDGLNNRRENLRLATKQQNTHNSRAAANNTSGFKGVFFHRQIGRWQATIKLDGKRHYLGVYISPEEAHAAYCAASAELHGEFGRTS